MLMHLQEPSYFLAYGIFAERGLELMPVRGTDCWGITPSGLRFALQHVQAAGKRAAFVYLVPSHGNPTGETYSQTCRLELMQVTTFC